MTRCVDCHWFDNAPPVARGSKSCSDIGELAQNAACKNFREKVYAGMDRPTIEPRKLASKEELDGFLGALMEESYASIFKEVLAEKFVLSQDAFRAVKTVQAELQAQGADIQAPGEDFQRTVGRLIDLLATYRLASAVGLGSFVDKIMEREISNKFPPRKD